MNEQALGISACIVFFLWFIVTDFRVTRLERLLAVEQEKTKDAKIENHLKLVTDDELAGLLEKNLGDGDKPPS